MKNNNRHLLGRNPHLFLFLLIAIGLASCKTTSLGNKNPETSISSVKQTSEFIEAKKHVLTGDYSKAFELLNNYLGKHPDDHAAHYELADLLYLDEKYFLAEKHILKAAELDEDNVWYLLLNANISMNTGNPKKVIEVYEKLFSLQNDRAYLEQIAFIQEQMGNTAAALNTYNRIENAFGPDENIGMIKYDIYKQAGKRDQALKEVEKLNLSFPKELKFKTLLAENYLRQGKSSEAKKIIDESLLLDPQDQASQFLMAEYYNSINQPKKAFQQMEQIFLNPKIDIDPKITVLLNLYQKPPHIASPENIQNLLSSLKKAHPEEAKTWSILGDFQLRDKEYEKARESFRNVIQIDSLKFEVWESLLICEYQLEDYVALIQEGDRALEIFPDKASLYLLKANALYEIKSFDQALVVIKKGLYFTSANSNTGRELSRLKTEILSKKNDNE